MLEEKLIQVFCDNFVAYYTAHSCHLNITGRNFYSDHKLLNKIYDDAQDQIDTIGELIRTLGAKAPETISEIMATAELEEKTGYDADSMLLLVLESQEHMSQAYHALYELADLVDEDQIANYAQDRILAHDKFIWMIKSTLEE